jgi:hypothetical protein
MLVVGGFVCISHIVNDRRIGVKHTHLMLDLDFGAFTGIEI